MAFSSGGLWYEWRGPCDGPVLVLSPGMGGSASYWEPNLSALSAHYHVLLYDHRGTGRSNRTLPSEVTVASMGEDIIALMSELGVQQPYFLGHALGGLIGLDVELRYFAFKKLVIVNGWASLDPHFERCFEIRLDLLGKCGPTAYVRAQPMFLYPASWISENIEHLDAEAEHQVVNFPPVENLEKRIAAAKAFEPLHDITCETLVIGAADDMLVPIGRSKELAHFIACGEFAEMKWGGHACNVTDPARFNDLVLDFLRR